MKRLAIYSAVLASNIVMGIAVLILFLQPILPFNPSQVERIELGLNHLRS
jgi:K+-transporting ATPase A subunit